MPLPSVELFFVFVAILGNFFLGLFTYLKNPRSSTNRLFLFFTLSVGTYLLINQLSLYQKNDVSTLLSIRVVMTSALFVNLFFLLLASTFPSSKIQLNKKIYWLAVVTTLILVPVTMGNLVFTSVNPSSNQPVPGPGMGLFMAHTLLCLGGGVTSLLKRLKSSGILVRTQIKLFLTGAGLMFGAILTTNFLLVIIFKTTEFVGLLPLYSLIFFGFISYAIIKHRFLDIGLIVARTVTYTIVIVLMAVAYAGSLFVLGQSFLGISLNPKERVALFVVATLTALSFRFIQKATQSVTDHFLFKGHYDTNTVLGDLSRVMASTLKLEDLSHGILRVLNRELRLSKGAFILLADGQVIDVKSEGFDPSPVINEDDIRVLSTESGLLVIDELEEGRIKQILREMGVSVILHLRTEGQYIGLLALGNKESGDTYSAQDLQLLEILAPQAAVATQNSLAYEEIKRFSITLQEEVERATGDLKKANEKLEVLDKLKDEFVGLASHELRTPMTAIKSYTWMVLNNKSGDISPKTREYLDRVYNSTERLIQLVNEMLDVSRIESGRVQLKSGKMDLVKLAVDVQQEFGARATEQNISVVISGESAVEVNADREKLHQVMENLVGNAFKFTTNGGKIEIGIAKDGNVGRVFVKDNGPGIAKEDLGKLFTKFGRGDKPLIALKQEGTGLGLYISKQYVELMGGKIWFDSELGKGATFSFEIPLYREAELV